MHEDIQAGDKPYVWCIAHRGASAYEHENSLPAIRLAADMGVDMAEIDIHATRDHHLVVYHDYCFNGRAIEDYTFKAIRQCSLPNGTAIPTLAEAWEATDGRCGLYIEIKSPTAAGLLDHEIRNLRIPLESILVGSFHHETIHDVKKLNPDVRTAVLFRCSPVDPIGLARTASADYVHFCWENMAPHPARLITPPLVTSIRQAGLGIILWHEERENELVLLQEKDIDGICSNDPPLLYRYFNPRRLEMRSQKD